MLSGGGLVRLQSDRAKGVHEVPTAQKHSRCDYPGDIRTDGVARKRRNELNRFKVQAKELLTTLGRPSMFRKFSKLLQSASNPSAKNTLLMLSWGSGSDPLKANLTDPVYSAVTPVVPPLLNVIEHE